MSIVTLKRKTNARYNNVSVNKPHFSLNGVHRSQGYVGQTMLSRHLVKTPMVGNIPKGYGGCCGSYTIKITYPAGINYQNDYKTIKSSVINTEGMIATKYRWILRPEPYATVKPDNNNNFHTQQDYVDKLRDQTMAQWNTMNNSLTNSKTLTPEQCCNSNLGIFTKNYRDDLRTNPLTALTKPATNYTSESQGEYIKSLRGDCELACTDVYNAPRLMTTFNHACSGSC